MNGISWRRGAAVLALCLFSALTAALCVAGPLYDPFLEDFQVGTWSRAEKVPMSNGYPAGLMEPARLDSVWLAAAEDLLDPNNASVAPGWTLRLLAQMADPAAASAWRDQAWAALADLRGRRLGAADVPFLLPERLTMAFGRAVATGDHAGASSLAERILAAADSLGLSPRLELVWDLRRRLAWQEAGTPVPEPDELWPALPRLGPFDSVNGWALWAARRHDLGLSVIPGGGDQTVLAKFLARLPVGSVTAPELYASHLSPDWQGALGAVLLTKKNLREHFRKFSHPPAGFAQQGLWVRGQRRLRRGLAGSYEQLAVRRGLKPGWRMDVWRRASEVRVLKGAWVEGLDDLRAALKLAAAGSGTKSLRRRLRQWTEQALVLALAHDDLRTAREIRDLGRASFAEAEGEAFGREIAQWGSRLSRDHRVVSVEPTDSVDRARVTIPAGEAALLRDMSPEMTGQFESAADRALWPEWQKWGLALADPSRVSGSRRNGAVVYQKRLARWQPGRMPSADADSVLGVVGQRLGRKPWRSELLRAAVDVDVGRLCAWRTPPRPSIVPDLLPAVRGSELDRHALLGFCLVIGDLRGILGLAYELPARGLTRAEKRLFLYPLPAPGAIRDAIAEADNEPALLLAVARNESLFEPAVRSRAGALGWMQIMPFHFPNRGAAAGADNWRVPAVSIGQGNRLLTENRRRYHNDPYRSVAAYNAGPGAAGRWDKQLGGQAPPDLYLAWIGYPETRAYVEKVLIDRRIYHEIIDALSVAAQSDHLTGADNEKEETGNGQGPDGIH